MHWKCVPWGVQQGDIDESLQTGSCGEMGVCLHQAAQPGVCAGLRCSLGVSFAVSYAGVRGGLKRIFSVDASGQ